MSKPRLTIIGVYRPVISEETWREQWQVTGDDEVTREHFRRLVLIEAVVEGLDRPFDFGKFGQMQPDHPDDPRSMQVGYDEGLLSAADGALGRHVERSVQGGAGTPRAVVGVIADYNN